MLVEKTQIMDQKAMSRAITRISFEIIERNKGAGNLCIVGIVTRGAQLAQRVAQMGYQTQIISGVPSFCAAAMLIFYTFESG